MSEDSKKTLSEEGFTKEVELESLEMWKLVETLKTKAIMARRHSVSSESQGSVDSEILNQI